LRDVLGAGQGGDAKSEWALIEKVLSEYQGEAPDTNRGGRPKTTPPAPGWKGNDTLTTATGVTLKRELDDKGFLIRISGKGTSTDMIEAIMQDIREKLEKG
jgi:ParB family transcriptional regulator, chromosome partitioning protein